MDTLKGGLNDRVPLIKTYLLDRHGLKKFRFLLLDTALIMRFEIVFEIGDSNIVVENDQFWHS